MKLFLSEKELENIKAAAVREARDKKEHIDPAVTNRVRNQCKVAFNFNDPNMVVFSVERMNMSDPVQEKTVIGYYLKSDAENLKEGGTAHGGTFTRQWVLYCSREAHNELATLFAGNGAPRIIKG